MVNVPPYCGVPKLSHQFPVLVVVAAVVGAVDVVDVGIAGRSSGRWNNTVPLLLTVGSELLYVVVVDEEQDANTSDITMRTVSIIQMAPLFI